jgi:D-3-phosphoglycerate dehydrogenase
VRGEDHLGPTEEAQENVGIEIAEAIAGRLLRGEVVNAVNMPNLDETTLKLIGPYLGLSEVLGKLISQIAPNQSDLFRIEYTGKVAEIDTTLVTRSALKGFLETGSTSGSANYLNAPALAEGRGIRVTESRPAEECEFTDLITVSAGNDKEQVTVSGTFFGSQPRVVRIDDHNLDAMPEGNLLIFENTDAPGVVGAIGRVLGEAKINIANMSLSRSQVGGKALSILNVDSPVDGVTLKNIEAIPGIQSATTVVL